MGRTIKTINVDEYVWQQYQKLFPRQASNFCENMMRNAVNIKLSIPDNEKIAEMRHELEEKEKAIDELTESVTRIKTSLQTWEDKEREARIKARKEQEETFQKQAQMSKALKNSGFLGRLGL